MNARMWLVALSVAMASVASAQTRPSTAAKPRPTAPVRASSPKPAQPASAQPASTQPGLLRVSASNNGLAASALVEVLDAGNAVIASGTSGADLSVPAGAAKVRVSLGAGLSAKESTVSIPAGGRLDHAVAFASGRFSLSISGSDTTGVAKVYRGAEMVGTMGHGGQLSLPAGTYDVKVTHKGVDKWFTGVLLNESQLRNISAAF